MPMLSIVTVVYNDLTGIQKTLNSVSSLKFKDFEYLVIDGNSKDGTKEFLESKKDVISKLISENDGGIYDAMNKGIANSNGRYIHILNAGDIYYSNSIFDKEIFNSNKDFIAFSVLKRGKKDYIWEPKFSKTYNSIRVAHPGLIVKKDFYNENGKYSLKFDYISDSLFILKNVNKKNIFLKKSILVDMEWGGVSTIPSLQNLKERLILINYYDIKILKRIFLYIYTILIYIKLLILKWLNQKKYF